MNYLNCLKVMKNKDQLLSELIQLKLEERN